MRTIGNRVRVTPPRVRIPPSPPVLAMRRRWKSTCGVFVCRFMSHAATFNPLFWILLSSARAHPADARAHRCWSGAPVAFRQSHSQSKKDTKQRRASWNRAHRHGYMRTLLAPPPTMPFCHTRHGLGLCQVSAWSMLETMHHTPSGFGMPASRTATHHGVPEARLVYRSACRETKHSPSCRTRSSAKKEPGFTEQIAACTILPENAAKVN